MDNRIEGILPLLMMGGFFLLCILSTLPGTLFFFDLAPASGTAQGYTAFQEKGGIFQMDSVCWKDTPYASCETFDPGGKKFEPGKYNMQYSCTTFAWAWEKANECTIVNATRIGDVS